MADTKISALPAATTLLTGNEEIPIVQGGVTKKVAANELGSSATLQETLINQGATPLSQNNTVDGGGKSLYLNNLDDFYVESF